MNARACLKFLVLLTGCGVELGQRSTEPEAVVEQQRTLEQVTGFGNPGGLSAFLYVPSTLPPNPALVVALHGCTMSAQDYAAAGWNGLAERHGFLVVYPQTTANNRCFVWWERAQQRRDGSQATSLVNLVRSLQQQRNVDPNRVFVTGLSAGGAMTAVMLGLYPDVFSAGAVMAGLPVACASTQSEAFSCMNSPPNLSPGAWGDRLRAIPGVSGFKPARVSVWHGTSDFVVRPGNADEIVDQFTNLWGIDATSDAIDTLGSATRQRYTDVQGRVLVERWSIPNMGHGTPVAPSQGCGTAGAYILDVGVCSSRHAAAFFGLLDGGADVPQGPLDAGAPNGTADAGIEPVRPDGGAQTDGGSSTCREWFAFNWSHIGALRAAPCPMSVAFCAVGSGDLLGAPNVQTWVRERRPRFFDAGRCQ